MIYKPFLTWTFLLTNQTSAIFFNVESEREKRLE